MKKRTVFAMLLALVLCFSLFAGCNNAGNGGADSDTIKVGFIGPLTGGAAEYGINCRNGTQMYIDEINAAGGVLGKQVELVALDDQHDAMEALNAYNRLVEQEGVVAIFGPVTSAPALAVAQEAAGNSVPLITASATAADVTSYGDNFFRSCFIDPVQGAAMAGFAKDELGAQTAAVLYNNSDDYSTGLKEAFEEACAANGVEVVATEIYGADAVDFKSQLTNIQATNPDVLFVPDYYNVASNVAAQSAEIGLETTFLGCDGWSGALEASVDPATLEGSYFSSHAANDDPAITAFAAEYESKFGSAPLAFAATAYDAAGIVFDAMERAGTTDGDALVEAIKNTSYTGMTGTFSYDENNNPIKEVTIVTIKDGAYVYYSKY